MSTTQCSPGDVGDDDRLLASRLPARSPITAAKDRALRRAAVTVAFTNLVAAGDNLLGRGVSGSWQRAKADAIARLDEAGALGATTGELDTIVREN